MREVISISIKNGVSFGAHPSFKDLENFGRKRMNLPAIEIKKLIKDQFYILQKLQTKKIKKLLILNHMEL